ncbi:MAG: tRNA (adenosine(37)-N6)-dimethylallyltransferase MiaA [Chitinophagales bacterium]|nr:tRNA (adenosine(37)-N6)-dimethylallyltransferase MiaA [Chitinophagales bacterium]
MFLVKTAYIIAGPTAVGKTAIAIALAKRLGTEIVSADSRQCYREMSIGTAKPSTSELTSVKHHFIDTHSVTTALDAADYETLALGYLQNIFATHDAAVVCGGTGLYIKALCEGLDTMPAVSDEVVHDVNNEYETRGLQWLQHAVMEEDPDFYKEGEIKNPARLLRALIFKRSVGESIINYRTGEKKKRDFRIVRVGLELPREVLYERINTRVDKMMENGLLDEVRNLYSLRHLKNLQTVGYSELFEHIEGLYTLQEAVDKIKQNTRHYAKRQMTWFRKDKEMHWLQADDPQVLDKILAL